MRRHQAACFFLVLVIVFVDFNSASGVQTETLQFGRFGTVSVYRESPYPSHVVLFVSGDGGWNLGVVDMANALCTLDAVVAGIDITRYFKELENSKEACSYPAADFELLSKFIQKKLDFPSYVLPVLVGYSSGATLVYATLVQAPPNTFRGGISLGFCPDLPLTKPFCRGYGLEWQAGPKGKGYRFLPASNLQTPWIALQGTIDQVCDPASTETYVKEVKGGEIVLLPKVGHGFSVQRNWMPEFKKAFLGLLGKHDAENPKAVGLTDLPLVEVPAGKPGPDIFAVIISGDGGWAGIDRELATCLSDRGISVIGLDSLQYFWKRRTPDESARDLQRMLQHYFAVWNKKEVVLIGYSLGADVLPFMANRLDKELMQRVRLVVLLGPGQTVEFEFHLTQWVTGSFGKTAHPILPEVEKLKGTKLICFYGEKETDSLCRDLETRGLKTVALKGAHHFGGDYDLIAETILREIGQTK
jgi:type IV secretory pathway VirJ component